MSARLGQRPRLRTDWFRVLTDLQYALYPNLRVAAILDVAPSTLRGWKNGAEPNHHEGHALLELWCDVTKKQLHERPMVRD